MQRHLLGTIALGLLLAAAASHLAVAGDSLRMIGDACLRLGIVLGVFWLALPNVMRLTQRLPSWLMATTLIAVALMAVRPRTIAFVGPLLVVVWILSPQWFGRKK